MREYILRRVLLLPFIMFGVAFMTFLAYRIIPGDAAILHCQLECTPDTVAALRHEFGLDRPPLPLSVDSEPPFLEIHGDSQFGGWLGGVLRGDLGSSFSYRTPVTDELGRRVPITVELLFLTVVLALSIGLPIGVLCSLGNSSVEDTIRLHKPRRRTAIRPSLSHTSISKSGSVVLPGLRLTHAQPVTFRGRRAFPCEGRQIGVGAPGSCHE